MVTQSSKIFESVTGAFVDLVTKLNEAAFKPLFRRLFDWAFNSTTGELTQIILYILSLHRTIVF
jgi:U3 small nucleolar RNA-associated protein 10